MSKFKIGDTVTVIDDRSEYRWERHIISDVEDSRVSFEDDFNWFREDQLALTGTIEALVPGDSVWDEDGRECKVLTRQGDAIGISDADAIHEFWTWETWMEMKATGWTVKTAVVEEEKVRVYFSTDDQGDNHVVTVAVKDQIEALLGIKK